MLKALVVLPLACGLFVGVLDRSPGMGLVAFYVMLLLEVLVGWSTNRQWPRGAGGRPHSPRTRPHPSRRPPRIWP
ncbi:hypothetical protein, partial [Mycobacterium sp. E1386]|uniref:hypothetical protein n=1 Tax=Mycobacterium sp. E1386 TaxID=1834126 RepID=UPI0012EA2F99